MTKVLEAASWEGRIFSGGWTEGAGEAIEVLDKATDEVLAVVGSAAPDDVRRAGETATRVQRVWALMFGNGHCACFPLGQLRVVAGSEASAAI